MDTEDELKLSENEKEMIGRFVGNKGAFIYNGNNYEYAVMSYMAGYEKEYIATIKRGDSISNGKGRSSRSALIRAYRNLD